MAHYPCDMNPIGIIHTPFSTLDNMPIQPRGAGDVRGQVIVREEFAEGLKDLDGFSHIFLLYQFHKARRTELMVTPFMDNVPRGVFATRSPLRPNHIGMSLVRLERIEGNILHILGADMLDATPLLDIKPYISGFDLVTDSRDGWMTASDSEVARKRSDSRFI